MKSLQNPIKISTFAAKINHLVEGENKIDEFKN